MEWGKCSEESTYVTMGRPPAASVLSQAAEAAQGQGRKGRKREVAAAKKVSSQQASNASAEVSPEEARRRLQVNPSFCCHSCCCSAWPL